MSDPYSQPGSQNQPGPYQPQNPPPPQHNPYAQPDPYGQQQPQPQADPHAHASAPQYGADQFGAYSPSGAQSGSSNGYASNPAAQIQESPFGTQNPYQGGYSGSAVGGPETTGTVPARRAQTKRSRGPLIAVAGGAAAVALIGGGAYAALGAFSQSGEQADVALPATAFAAATLDLDPSAAQKVDAIRFASKFPGNTDLDWDSESNSPRKSLYEGLTKDMTGAPAWSEVDEWLGDRAGVAILPPAEGSDEPAVVTAVQVKDLDQAKKSLAGLTLADGTTVGVAGEGDWVILAQTEEQAQAAVAATAQQPLSESPTYTADVEALGEQGVATAWLDYDGLLETVKDNAPTTDVQQQQALDSLDLSGHMAATMRFAGSDLEVVGLSTQQSEGQQLPEGTTARLEAPENAVAALAYSGLDQVVVNQWTQLLDASGAESDIAAIEDATGIKLPDDLASLVGKQTTAVLTENQGIGVRVYNDDPALDDVLKRTERAFVDLGAPSSFFNPQRTSDGYALEFGQAKTSIAEGGALAQSEAFTNAVPDAEGAQAIFYLDVNKSVALAEEFGAKPMKAEDKADLEPMQALGISATISGDTAQFRMKLTTR